jgi:hypothetical protein
MLHAAGLYLKLWTEANNNAVYINNPDVPRRQEVKTPYEIWKGVKQTLFRLRVF